ncbi:MAG: glycosyltransferase [Oscillatoriales cyanobacterium SM2_3_0]|nr:glycosyltransferase [Oscillatoriales cyanobacterium SM2_3_0]
MKIALISQPGEVAAPVKQRGSIGIWSEQVCRRLIPADQVVFYGNQKRGSSSPAAIALMDEGIEYRGVRGRLDQVLRPLRVLDRWGISNPQRPIFASTFYGRGYIGQIARDLSQQHCNIAHVHNYSQFVPALKRMNPQIKTVLHMHCEWLTQLDPDLIASRLHHTDLVIGCSDYITQKIRDRFPAFADRCQTVYNGVDPVLFTPASSPPI